MHPFFDEKEYFAGAYENNLFICKVSKNVLNINDAKKFTNQHYDNIKYIAWQNKQNGLLASVSTDKLIQLYDIRSNKNPVIKIHDDDVCKSMKFSNINCSLLATGYNKRLKIWDLRRSTVHPVLNKIIFKECVDILEWHLTQNLLLTGSKRENLLKIYSVKDGDITNLLEIKIKDMDDAYEISNKLTKCFFIPGNSILAVCEKRAYIYHLGNNFTEVVFDQIIEFPSAITNFRIMTNNLNSHYFIYTDKENNFTARL